MFYDRDLERAQLTDMLQNPQAPIAKIILLLGYSGVGKTGLMSELFSTSLKGQAHVHIHVTSLSPTAIEGGYFFNRLYDSILKKRKEQKDSDISQMVPLVSLRLRQFSRFLLRWIASLAHIYENEPFIERKEDAEPLQKLDFIVDCLNETPYIVDFENVQRIDAQSLDFLQIIADRAPHTVFVFEYTLEPQNECAFQHFYAEINRFRANIHQFRLERLNEEDALRLSKVPIANETQKENILKNYREKNGNLYQIILYNDQMPNIPDQIQKKIYSLVHDRTQATALFLLNLCYLNGGTISKDTLRTLTTIPSGENRRIQMSESQLAPLLKNLLSQGIIKEKNGGLTIHDSVLQALEHQENTPMLYVAYNTLVQHYSTWEPIESQQQVYRLSQLFSLYLRFTDDRLLTILPDIRRSVVACKYPQAIYLSLQKFIDLLHQQTNVNPNVYQEVNKLLFDICIETGDTDTAWEILSHLTSLSSGEERLLKARIHELGMKQEDLNAINELIVAADIDPYERLMLELSRIHVAMRILPQAETVKLVREIVADEAYQQYPEYAFVLSDLAELIDSPKAAIDLYRQGISQLVHCGKKRLAGYLYTNVCMSYGYMGELENAQRSLEKARDAGIDEAVYLNNLVVLALLRQDASEECVAQLQNALLLHSNLFERLIIQNNLLIVHVLLQNWTEANDIFRYLQTSEFETFQYGEFLQMCYQNLLFYCENQSLSEEAELYRNNINELIQSKEISQGTKAVAKAMLLRDLTSDIFYAKYPYRAEFLCYWGIPPALRS